MKISHFCCGAILIGLLVAVEACRGTPPNPPTTPPPPISSPILLDEAGGAPEYVCEFADTPITIDGKAVETAWKRAPVIDNFIMPWTADKRRPKNATRARVLWDREFFYFFAEMDDPDLVARPTEHNGRVWENDCFEVFLKPAADKPGYYEFEVNADNVTFEMYIPDREKGGWPEFKDKHPFKFDTAVVLRGAVGKHTEGGGWSVEGKLRWA
ncbi:MAG TPA: carbohydrate-binding family 9-like protein, partial [Tepidisphaeraceae bacterium]